MHAIALHPSDSEYYFGEFGEPIRPRPAVVPQADGALPDRPDLSAHGLDADVLDFWCEQFAAARLFLDLREQLLQECQGLV